MCTVKGDLHDLGKNMVGAMLRTSGFDVHDMGKDVSADRIIEAINELNPQILGMSALLTTTVPYQETVIKRLEAAGMRDRIKVMVGGAPVTPEWADKIGADGYANNAPEAVEIAKKLTGGARVTEVATTVLTGPGGDVRSATPTRSASSASASTPRDASSSPRNSRRWT